MAGSAGSGSRRQPNQGACFTRRKPLCSSKMEDLKGMSTLARSLVALLLAVGLLSLAAPVSAQALPYLPKDSEVVMSFHLRQLLTAKLVKDNKQLMDQLKQFVQSTLQNDDKIAAVLKTLNFDVFRDLDSVTVGANNLKTQRFVVVIQGRFNPEKIAAVGKDQAQNHPEALKIHEHGKYALYEVTPPGQQEQVFVSVVDKGTILVSKTKADLTRALGQKLAELKPELKTLLNTVDPKTAVAFAATSKALAEAADENDNPQMQIIKQMLPKMNGVATSAALDSDLQFQVAIAAKSTEFANELTEKSKQGIAFAQLMANSTAKENQQLAPLADIAQSLRATVQGTTTFIRGRVEGRVIVDALQSLKNQLP